MHNSKRREFIALLGCAAAVWPLSAKAQQAESKYTVGILSAGTNVAELTTVVAALRQLITVEDPLTFSQRPRVADFTAEQ
jgi:ribonuclease HI